MAKQTSTGVLLAVVSGLPATEDQAGYEALSWQNIGEVIDLPEYGPTVQVVESNPLATGITEKRNGFINFGSLSLGLELDVEDAGQQILEAGVPTPPGQFVPHSFRVTFPDGTVEYYHGGIFSYTRAPGSANSMIGSTVQIEINSKIVRVLAP
jgi:hypothetical protein